MGRAGESPTKMSELRERVARAICDVETGAGHYDSAAVSVAQREAYRRQAVSAIAVVIEECRRTAGRLSAFKAPAPTELDPIEKLVRIVGESEPHKPAVAKPGPNRRPIGRRRR